MSSMTLSRYFAWRFFVAVAGVFAGVLVLVAFVDYIDVMRKASDVPNAPTSQLMLMSFYRVPQTMERLLPFSVLVGVALGAIGTMVYNPLSASLREASKRIESKIFGQTPTALEGYDSGYWVRQRGADGDSILNARQSHEQGLKLTSITVFTFNPSGEFKERIEAQGAELQPGAWQLSHA